MEGKDSTSFATQVQMGVDSDLFYDGKNGKAVESGKYYCKRGGYINGFQFDPKGYHLSPKLLTGLDRIYQWSLYVAQQALQDSQHLGKVEALANCGVILGSLSIPTQRSHQLVSQIYKQSIDLALQKLLQQPQFDLPSLNSSEEVSEMNRLGSGYLSALVAQGLGLSGVNFTFDAACASSIFAIQLASDYLLSGKADLMLAGAVSGGDPWIVHNAFSLFQAYPEDGISRPLDKSSDGLLTGEGAGMVVLKRHSDAVRDGDRIYATIAGIGLSNDGKGKHFFSPNPKGQLLAFERAYGSAGISPQEIDYIECHATGTPLGDRTELNSMETFFSPAAPLIGSVKSNLGHLLTAAGMPSLLKVILSMEHGMIPPTIGVQEPLHSANNGIAAEQVVREATPWPHQSELKRAAISAFGFGGTNSHLVLEQGEQNTTTDLSAPDRIQSSKLAIVGMDAYFGTCDGLDAFERCIHQGKQSFIPLPEQRWHGIDQLAPILKNYGLPEQAPMGAYIKDFEIDSFGFKIPPDDSDQPSPQQLLMLKVADRALQDAGLQPGKNVAVIVAMRSDLSIHQWRSRSDLSWQIQEKLHPTEQLTELAAIASDSLHPPVKVNLALSHISGNLAASRIAAHWDFTGPAMTLSAEENSVFKALEVAQLLLSDTELDAVVVGAVDLAGGLETVLLGQAIAPLNTGTQTLSFDRKANGPTIGEGAGAVVLKRLDKACQAEDRIYAVIDSVSLIQDRSIHSEALPKPPSAAVVEKSCQEALSQAEVKPETIGYLEVFGSGVESEDRAEIQGLTQAYRTNQERPSCAIGSIKANIGHTYAASGMASLIKTALCLHHQYLPATPQWTGPKSLEVLQESPFYIPGKSHLWFVPETASRRIAAINGLGADRSYAHLIVSEEPSPKDLRSRYLEQTPFYLFPLAAVDLADILAQLSTLQTTIENAVSLSSASAQVFSEFQQQSQAPYAVAITGQNKEELCKEIQRAHTGIPNAFEQQSDWKTPVGSYFTALPQGQKGGVAFVYPGAFTSYIGFGYDINRLFPRIMDSLSVFTASARMRGLMDIATARIYPRSLEKFSPRKLEKLETQLQDDATTMLLFGTGAAVDFTSILHEYFKLQPQAAFGYSLGEFSMMYALKVWTSADELAGHLDHSNLFKTRLSGPMEAVREFWGLSQASTEEDWWGTYVLLSEPDLVKDCLEPESRVYLTHINTPTEVVIAGDKQACQRVIQQLQCDYFLAPSKHVLHCEAMRSELNELTDWFTLPVQPESSINFYSAASYSQTSLSTPKIADNIANALCQPLDFPHLVNQVYADGVRIFIELGPAGTCTRWIGETLKQKEHVAIAFNTRGVDDHTSVLRALAKLISHRVELDLSPLYEQPVATSAPQKALAKTISLGGNPIHRKILTSANRDQFAFKPISSQAAKTSPQAVPMNTPELVTTASVNSRPSGTIERSNPPLDLEHVRAPFKVQPHSSFLQMRQDSLRQMGQLIEMQMSIAQQMMNPAPVQNSSHSNGHRKLQTLERPPTQNGSKSNRLEKLSPPPTSPTPSFPPVQDPPVIFNESSLLEFAIGKIAPVFGPDYAAIDTYPNRIRLPMPPYLFVSRVTRLEAERGVFKPCFIETEYDIPTDAWYSVDGQIPAAIFVEASQGNIVLISYLGIDFEIKGQRSFRALDGTIKFVGETPKAGETFRCEVRINSFTRGSGTVLYFYNCDYFVGDRKFLELKAGAGFFTEKELKKAPGVTLTKQELAARSKIQKQLFAPLLSCPKVAFSEQDLIHLSTGNLAACFGLDYAPQQAQNPSLRIPSSAFLMIDRVLAVNPSGGDWGLGVLVAEKDLHPEQWYFNCHFKDDYCMPGTVIGEGAAQLLQFYLLYLGLQTLTTQGRFHPIPNLTQSSRSRGQVVPTVGTLVYQLEVFEVGLKPTPFLKAEATVKFKGKTISMIKNLGIQLLE